jgi:hypothetical protein
MGLRELLEFLLPAASLKWWPVVAAATHGQKGGLAALEADNCSSMFFILCERIFHCLGLALKPPAQPSGFVPGCCRGGADLKQFVAGGVPRSNYISVISFRVLCVILQGPIVISFSLLDLLVILYPPLE